MRPAVQILPTINRKDGLIPYELALKVRSSGEPIIMTGCLVEIKLKNSLGGIVWEFSTAMSGDHQLQVNEGNKVVFPRILSWDIQPSTYNYTLKTTAPDGFVSTRVEGTWTIKTD
jgi:hypothetical protein